MAGSISSEDRADPNLTPILDMVFQLITFFMLVINFKTANMDMNLHLPAIGSARPVEVKGQDLLVLNIDKRGRLRALGQEMEDIPGFIASEASAVIIKLKGYNVHLREGDELPSMVVIRADRQTPFKFINRVVVQCQKYGFRTFSLKALNRKEEP